MERQLSILPFLPLLLHTTEPDALQWPSELGSTLKSLVGGPSVSQVHGAQSLCNLINVLRNHSRLPVLSAATLHGFTTYFDEDHLQAVEGSNLHRLRSDSYKDKLEIITKQTRDIEVASDVSLYAVQSSSEECTMGIATGNWGCGAFGGDPELKSLLQWIAASQAGRPFLQYFTFGGSHGPSLQQVADSITSEKWVVGELWGLLVDYGTKRLRGVHKEGLFEWILPRLSKADAIEVPQER